MSRLSKNDEPPELPSLGHIRSVFKALCVEQNSCSQMAEAIQRLQNDLTKAVDLFTRDKTAGEIVSLWSLYGFLENLRVSTRLRVPLLSVISELTGVPGRKGSEKPLRDTTDMLFASVSLDTLVTDGTDMNVAARKIVEVAGHAMSATELINFRKNLQRNRAQPHIVASYQDLRRSTAEQWGQLTREERAMEALLSVYGNVVQSAEC
jgi:hypothetical protein